MIDMQFHECQSADCGLRFPAFEREFPEPVCPRCGEPTLAVADAVMVKRDAENRPKIPVSALLDNIRSTWNVGSIFRSAHCLGLAHLHLCGITATPAHTKVTRTALGAEEHVAWTYHANAVKAVETLKADGYQIWALEMSATSVVLKSAESVTAPTVLIVGNERAGVDPALLALADRTLHIPMHGVKSSLNVAVAFGIAAHRLAG